MVDGRLIVAGGTLAFRYEVRNASKVVHDPAVGLDEASVLAILVEAAGDAVDYVMDHIVSFAAGALLGVVLTAAVAMKMGRGGREDSLDPEKNPYFRRPRR